MRRIPILLTALFVLACGPGPVRGSPVGQDGDPKATPPASRARQGAPAPSGGSRETAPGRQEPTSPTATPSQVAAPRGYLVGVQDILRVVVYDEPSLSGTFRVDNDGTFTFPFIGRVAARGRILSEIEADIAKRLSDGYVRRPQVSVEMEQYRSRSVFVMGEVRSPGKYPLSGEMALMEALVLAGGTNATASNEIVVLRAKEPSADRQQPVLPDAQNTAELVRVSINDLQSGKFKANIALEDGDTIFIPKAERIFVTGFVRSPGSYVWERGMTVLQAVSLAGGVTERGSNRRLKVIRILPNGQRKEVGVKLEDQVHAGDTIIVPQRLL